MEPHPDASSISLTSEETQILSSWMEAPETPRTVAQRATIIRELARGRSNSQIARDLSVSRGTVIRWRRRFKREGIQSLAEVKPGRGRRRSVTSRVVRKILDAAGTDPSMRSIAEKAGVSTATVYRVWDQHGISRRGKEARQAFTWTGGELVVLGGVFLDPPDRVIALRLPPSGGFEPAHVGLPRTFTRTLDRFDRKVVGDPVPRDRERALLKFLRRIEDDVPRGSRVVLLVDRAGGTHRRASVRRWLASRDAIDVRTIDDADSTAALLARALPEPSHSVAFRRLIEDVEGYLLTYAGEPDRFVWHA